ncbi:MAG: heme-binding protein [Actinobacteria bacterium]|nr:heme-binding protein [Actinomycetota bacterium]
MTERQEFKVLQTYSDFELREYLPCVIAEVKVSAQYSTASSSAFSTLFNYISKGNKSSEAIAMTAPVITAQKADSDESGEWHVSFVMPAGRNIGQMPNPNNSQIELRELATEICVAKSFRGKATDELSRKITNELRSSAAKENIALSTETRICRFDPPFKPSFFQYNEILIPANL